MTRRRARPRLPLALAGLVLAVAGLTGCDGGTVLGSGPLHSVAVDEADGTVYVVRSFSVRAADVGVILDVDPATGAAAPILPRRASEDGTGRTETVTGVSSAILVRDDPADDPTLLLCGPDVGVARLAGPFTFRGALPVLESLVDGPVDLPTGKAMTAWSPDRTTVVVFERGGDPMARTFRPILVDHRRAAPDRLDASFPDRSATWIDDRRLRFGPDTIWTRDDDGTWSAAAAAADAPGERTAGDGAPDASGDGAPDAPAVPDDRPADGPRPIAGTDWQWSTSAPHLMHDAASPTTLDRPLLGAVRWPTSAGPPPNGDASDVDRADAVLAWDAAGLLSAVRDGDTIRVERIELHLDRSR